MNATPAPTDWQSANQAYLVASIERVELSLRKLSPNSASPGDDTDLNRVTRTLQELQQELPSPSALDIAVEVFGLSAFERDVLLACAGVELNASFSEICRSLHGEAGRSQVTFGLALAGLPEGHWSALHSAAPLRYWRLLEVEPGDSLTSRSLRIDERILHFLAGVSHLDERLAGLLETLEPPASQNELPDTYKALADRVAAAWSEESLADLSRVQLWGTDGAAKRAVGAQRCMTLGIQLFAVDAADLPSAPSELEELARLWNREVLLSSPALLIDVEEFGSQDALRKVTSFARKLRGPVLLCSRDPLPGDRLVALRLDVDRPGSADRRKLWQSELSGQTGGFNGGLESVVSHFALGVGGIRSASARLRERAAGADEAPDRLLWDICREQARPQLDDLAQRIQPMVSWSDLVVPEAQLRLLHDVTAQVRQRSKVYETWGFGSTGSRGLGISALFTGPSGTGKTMAAEVIAHELRLDLYRIDLSQVVNKYIGETEKNLRRVFDAAEDGGVVLLFDEADAIFGKRSQVKDSHDRYANIEVSYLLQRMESYRGLAILTTNFQNAIDKAFLRRIRFVVHFPFPDETQRAEIWRRMFPAETPVERLDYGRLARLNFAGGNIRNVAMNAAFLAAEDGNPVRQGHVLRAARHEYVKLELPFSDSELTRLERETP